MKRTRGITLLEMMVTVAIASILLSAALVGIQTPVDRQRENEATRELWASTLRARQRAISTNQPVRIVVEENVPRGDGTSRTVARWEQLRCDNEWDNATCPANGCENATCRANPDCCSEVGPDIVIPVSMNAAAIHGLCYMPGTGRPVRPGDLGCMRDSLDDLPALDAAAPGNLRFDFTSGRARSLIMVEPRTGLASVLDCNSQAAIDRPVAECAN
ncbi:pilus assembly FimT family protein [Myxococcus xanthus]|uniref:Prepilin-type N-terminal cleavage/methylation domain-containing protein n=1 Tax=Myxococcus xanthus TaxID=34 RepID=A0A7Y4IJR7_MYXXA|nr:prepilin-type N-terminal cleavage/methylation domain-containing protein [Myxococcus xanthus]NOJ80558.1 prepilin-type N-terminal cleavage/methylation domain-containing protein [Myxococcus xanthus]NOJ87666.1 prepilin-type N-terminal cleavage/methylation domain-containing protein [Myxococcus xanthus]